MRSKRRIGSTRIKADVKHPHDWRRAGAAFAMAAVVCAAAGCSLPTFRSGRETRVTVPAADGLYPAARAVGGAIDDLDPASLAIAAERTAAALERSPGSQIVTVAGRSWMVADVAASARYVASVARTAANAVVLTGRLVHDCDAYPAGETAKVTGYYEPVLHARRMRDDKFLFPIYRAPNAEELSGVTKRLGHVPTRADIDGHGALDGLGLEIAWLDDPVERFLLHVQGSGRLVFEDGTAESVGYAATNGLEYRSIGSVMVRRGLLERSRSSAGDIRAWLAVHPEQRDAILNENPRYVFFRDNGAGGPVGALGTTLVAGRSIATDESHLPRGTFAWLRTTPQSSGSAAGAPPVSRFVFANDTGAAIVGPARVDLFEGSGEEAGRVAGARNASGELFVLRCRGR
jgi:membrane-bound lytic murein transglycosylase A